MMIIRFLAIFVYVIAALLALKSFADLSSGKAAVEGDWGWTFAVLLACLGAAIGAWMVDRYYCRKSTPAPKRNAPKRKKDANLR